LSIVAAAFLGFLMKILKQPLMLGYLLAGVLIGPVGLKLIATHEEITTIAEIGLILLLFMIGLEIDLKKMLSAGKLVIVTGIVQFPIYVGLGYLIATLLTVLGVLADDSYVRFYVAIAVSISSTMVVVKLLYEKMELSTLPGRITTGILVFQDIWAIIVLAIQPNLAKPEVLSVLETFGIGALLVGGAILVAKYILPLVFKSIAKLPELLVVVSLAWCFLISLIAAHPAVGLSMELGALIAGVTLATFPYNLDIIAKVINIRFFFITLFFVALGMQIPIPNLSVVGTALIISGVVFFLRFIGVFGVLSLLKGGHRTSILTGLNLTPISEFSLVILTLGIGYGHIERGLLVLMIWVFVLLAVVSSYVVKFSHPLQHILAKILVTVGIKDLTSQEDEESLINRPIVLLGVFKIANSFLDQLDRNKNELINDIMVVDFNPVVREALHQRGIPCVYADISHPDTLVHAGISHAKVVVCSIENVFLKGTTNLKLIEVIHSVCPDAKIIVTGDNASQSLELYRAGADIVLQPSALTAEFLASSIGQAMNDELDEVQQKALKELENNNEFLK
jgi:Kef-type K+ transport system membrane component KefB/Trk K+ transport system NAD-binding subunit